MDYRSAVGFIFNYVIRRFVIWFAFLETSLSRHSGVTSLGGPSITVSMNEITHIGVYLTRLIDVLSAALDSGVAISIIAIFFW